MKAVLIILCLVAHASLAFAAGMPNAEAAGLANLPTDQLDSSACEQPATKPRDHLFPVSPFMKDYRKAQFDLYQYVKNTEDFLTPPCIVPREVWDETSTQEKIEKSFNRSFKTVVETLESNKPYAHLKSSKVGLLRPNDIHSLIFHHSETPQFYGPRDILKMHTDRKWADIGYHYIISKRPPSDEAFRARWESDENLPAMRFDQILSGLEKRRREFQEDIRKARSHIVRNNPNATAAEIGACSLEAEWLIYEARSTYFRGAQAGNYSLRYLGNEVFELRTGSGYVLQYGEDGQTVSAPNDDVGRPMRLKLSPGKEMLEQLDINETIMEFGYRIPTGPLASDFFDENGMIKGRKGATFSVSANEGTLGMLVMGGFSEGLVDKEGWHNWGHKPDALFKDRMPSQPAWVQVGTLINHLFESETYPNLKTLLAHRSGFFDEHINCVGGVCPGDGCMPLVRAFQNRFSTPYKERYW